MTYTIRPVEARDNLRVKEIVQYCLDEYHAPHEGSAWSDPDLDRFSEVYAPEDCGYWVAEDENGLVVGGAGIGPLGTPGVCELRKMYCMPEARGQGVGSRLIEAALAFARQHYTRCYLESFRNMTTAHRFYERHGFVRTEEHLGEVGHYLCDVLYIRDL